MDKVKRLPDTGLNSYDRKILSKYTRVYTNMIESSTAETGMNRENKDKPIKRV
jgi:hypothetical protein